MTRKQFPAVIRMSFPWIAELKNVQTYNERSGWVPARPLPGYFWRERFRATWLVWTGRADALIWPGDQ